MPPHENLQPTSTVEALEREVEQLRQAVASRQVNGVATGLFAERYHCTPDQAWAFLVRLSRDSNLKVRDIARVVVDAQAQHLSAVDRALAEQLDAFLPGEHSLLRDRA